METDYYVSNVFLFFFFFFFLLFLVPDLYVSLFGLTVFFILPFLHIAVLNNIIIVCNEDVIKVILDELYILA